ncbi:MAG: hypothetical protein WC378_02965 [Opitutaceae bacterium]|jgi:hypothetical protein
MTPEPLNFPVLCIHKATIFTVRTLDALTSTTAAALRGGLFTKLRVIDSIGVEYVVSSAKKLKGIGPFFGYNLFLNQRIRVALDLEPTGKVFSSDEVRALVLKDFRGWHGWESRDDFDQLKQGVASAASVGEILRLVTR